MFRKPLTSITVLLLLACVALAETPVSQPVLGPAPGDQHGSFLATNGTDFLAACTDMRSGSNEIYAARIAADGRILDPAGIHVAPGLTITGLFRTAGAYTLLAFNTSGLIVVRIDDDGAIVDGPRVVLDHPPDSAASNGVRIVLADHSTVHILDDRGNLLERDVPTGAPTATIASVASNGSTFLVATISTPDARVDLTALDAAGHPKPPSTHTGLPSSIRPQTASDGSDYLVVFSGRPFDYEAVQADAAARVRSETTRASMPVSMMSAALAWSGSGYLLLATRHDPQGALVAIPLQRDGSPGAEHVLNPTAPDRQVQPAVVWNGTEALGSWEVEGSDHGSLDVAAERLQSDGAPIDAPELVATSANAQDSPEIVTGGTNDLVVWDEPSGIYAARLTREGTPVDGRGIAVAASAATTSRQFVAGIHPVPRAAFDGRTYAVIWAEPDVGLRLQRVDAETGAPIGRAITAAGCVHTYDIGRDDQGLVVFTASCLGQLFARRVDSAGSLGTPVPLSPAGMAVESPRAAWNGSEWLVVWNELVLGPTIALPPRFYRNNVYGTRVTSALAVTGSPIAIDAGDSVNDLPPAVATNGSDFFVAWSTAARQIEARAVAADGSMGAVQTLAAGIARDVVWDGARYAVAYKLAHDLYLTHGNDAVVISSGWPDSRDPSLVVERGAIRAAYVRVATEPVYGGVGRVFVNDVVERRRVARP